MESVLEESGSIRQMFSKDSRVFEEAEEGDMDFFPITRNVEDQDFLDQEYYHYQERLTERLLQNHDVCQSFSL